MPITAKPSVLPSTCVPHVTPIASADPLTEIDSLKSFQSQFNKSASGSCYYIGRVRQTRDHRWRPSWPAWSCRPTGGLCSSPSRSLEHSEGQMSARPLVAWRPSKTRFARLPLPDELIPLCLFPFNTRLEAERRFDNKTVDELETQYSSINHGARAMDAPYSSGQPRCVKSEPSTIS